MSPPAAAAPLHLAWVRLGGFDFAVPIAWLQQVLRPALPLRSLPRRDGPVTGLLPGPDGVLPVVDLARWLRLPEAEPEPGSAPVAADSASALAAESATEAPRLALLLRQGRRRLGLWVSAVQGVRQVPARQHHRLHHTPAPEELFDAVVDWPGAPAALPVLEVARLFGLLDTWIDAAAPEPESTLPACVADDGPAGHLCDPAATPVPGVVVRTGALRLWLPAAQVQSVVPAPPRSAVDLLWWRERPLPLVSLQPPEAAAAQGATTPAAAGEGVEGAGPASGCVVVLGEPARGLLGLRVAALERLWDWPAQARALGSATPGLPPQLDALASDGGATPVYRLDVGALLRSRPESSLALSQASAGQVRSDAAPEAGQLTELPFIVFEAPALRCIAADRVREIVRRDGSVSEQGLNWRGGWVPWAGDVSSAPASIGTPHQEGGGLVMLIESPEGLVARPIHRLRFLVPAGRGRLQRMARGAQPALTLLVLPEHQPPLVVQQVDW